MQVLRAYGGTNGSGSDRLDAPQRLVVDVFGYALVLDRNNDRIVLLNPNLFYARDVVGRAAIKQPRRMYFDADTGHLFVGFLDGRVAVFRVINVTSPKPPPTPTGRSSFNRQQSV